MLAKSKRPILLCTISAILIYSAATGATVLAASSVAEMRADFHRLLDRPKVPLEAVSSTQSAGPFTLERGRFHSEANQTVPFAIVKPAAATGALPAVIVLHGTGGNKEDVEDLCRPLTERGMLCIAIDARYHGDRVPGGADGSEQYEDAVIRAWHEKDASKQEHPFYYDTVYDLWRTVDYLQSRKDVDSQRIGMIGISMGGIETWMAAATDERIKVAVPAIAVQSFRWSLESGQWQGRASTIGRAHQVAAMELGEKTVNSKAVRALWDKIIPGIMDEFDCPSMLRGIAPRPLLILSSDNDPNNPLGGAKLAFAAAEDAYRSAKASDRLKIDVARGVGHSVTNEQWDMAFKWLARWLKQ